MDPLYAYHGSVANAGNLHETTEILNALSNQTLPAGVALMVVNHFNKTGAKTLDLSSITQAGHREWVHCWLLVMKRSEPDIEQQRFELEFKLGSREGYSGHYDLDIELGPLDLDTLMHEGTPTVEIRLHAARTNEDPVTTVLALLAVNPWGYTKTELVKAMGGNASKARDAVDQLVADERITTRKVKREKSNGRTQTVDVYGRAAA